MEEIAKLIVLLALVSMFVLLLRQGPPGPKRWLRAKFLGETS